MPPPSAAEPPAPPAPSAGLAAAVWAAQQGPAGADRSRWAGAIGRMLARASGGRAPPGRPRPAAAPQPPPHSLRSSSRADDATVGAERVAAGRVARIAAHITEGPATALAEATWACQSPPNRPALPDAGEEQARQSQSAASTGPAGLVWEAPRKLPVLDQCQVLVVGGGPSGLSAAVAARRAGADVLLIERFGCFGGVITTVGMETLGWYRYEGTIEGDGIGREMERLATRMGGSSKWPYNDSECLDAERFKSVADRLLADAGVRPLLHTMCVEAIMDGDTIRGVVTESKSGRMAVLAEVVIDATGDADVAHLAGAEYRRLPKAEAMGCTSVFNAAGVDVPEFRRYTEREAPRPYADWSSGEWQQQTAGKEEQLRSPYLSAEFGVAQERGLIPSTGHAAALGGTWSALSEAGEATNLNLVHLKGFDCTDVRDLTRAEIEGRRQAEHAVTALRGVVPGFERAKLRNHAMTLGVRDTRKIVGRTELTAAHVTQQGTAPDSIGVFPEFIDGYNILVLPTTGRYFQVPLGCMIPPAVDNLLVAGRCVSGDRTSHAAMRNMMACTVTGQGAGAAAAVAVDTGASTQRVEIAAVQAELRRQGVRLE